MQPLSDRWQALRVAFADLGPLRRVAVYVALASTLGTLLLLTNLPAVVRWLPESPWSRPLAVALAVATAVALAWLPPAAAALGAGYCLGGGPGTAVAVAGIAMGGLWARWLAPYLGAPLFAFMRERPRAVAVRGFCRGGPAAASLAVARLRWAAPFPFAAANLLLAVAAVPARSVLFGSAVGAMPLALLGAVAGDGPRTWRERGAWPAWPQWVAAAAAVLAAYMLRRASRRAWRAVAMPD